MVLRRLDDGPLRELMLDVELLACPSCNATMMLSSGWTALSATTAGIGVLQCGQCGHSISVPSSVYDEFKRQAGELLASRTNYLEPPKKTSSKRARGAG